MELLEVLTKTGKIVERNSPTILTFLGVSGLVTTIGLTIKATHEVDKKVVGRTEVDLATVKFIAKQYLPVVLVAGGSIACIIGSNSINAKRNLALVGAYKLSEETLKKYPEKIREVISGPKVDNKQTKKSEKMVIFGTGDVDCYDQASGRYFRASLQEINTAVANANAKLWSGQDVSINDIYDEVGLAQINMGDDVGWRAGGDIIEANNWSMISEDGRPVLVVAFIPEPVAL